MELSNEFTVDIPIAEAWELFTDLTRIAPCMPGAKLESVEGEEYHGVIKVKVGPVTVEYKGKAAFLERESDAHRAILRAEGRETRGQGNASATIIAQLEPDGTSTRVSVMTNLAISGRVAQFGRGVLTDVTTKLLEQFVASLEATGLGGAGGIASSKGEQSVGEPRSRGIPGAATATCNNGDRAVTDGGGSQTPPEVPINLVQFVGPALVKRFASALAALVAMMFFWRRFRHGAHRESSRRLRACNAPPPGS